MDFSFKTVLLAGALSFYLVYTGMFAVKFQKHALLTGRRKLFHSIMIWLFPFVWIWILKSYLKQQPGSHEFPNKMEPAEMKDNTQEWVVNAATSANERSNSM